MEKIDKINDLLKNYEDESLKQILKDLSPSDLTMSLNGNEIDHQYTFEEGYFQSIERLFQSFLDNTYDLDSCGIPFIFLCRHYLELALKNSIFNIKITFGNVYILPSRKTGHDLKELYNQYNSLLTENKIKCEKLVSENLNSLVINFDKYSKKMMNLDIKQTMLEFLSFSV